MGTWCGLSANLECMSKTCCTRFPENTGRKKSPKIRPLGTITQLCQAISSQLRHVSTIGKTAIPPPTSHYGELPVAIQQLTRLRRADMVAAGDVTVLAHAYRKSDSNIFRSITSMLGVTRCLRTYNCYYQVTRTHCAANGSTGLKASSHTR